MQLLWGKILAGEVEKPGTFSLRTQDALRNLTQREAELFEKVAGLAFSSPDCSVAFVINDMEYYGKLGISLVDFVRLTEIGLFAEAGILSQINSLSWNFSVKKPEELAAIPFGKYGVLLGFSEPQPKVEISILNLTKVGMELLLLINQQPNEDYFRLLAKKVKEKTPLLKSLWYAPRHPSGRGYIESQFVPIEIE